VNDNNSLHRYDSTPTQYNMRVGPPELTSDAPRENVNGAFTADGDTVTHRSFDSSASVAVPPPSDLAASAAANNGQLGAHLKPTDVIRWKGIETSVGALIAAREIEPSAQGYRAVDQQAAPKQEAIPQPEAEAFSGDLEDVAEALHSSTGMQTQTALIAELASRGAVSDLTLNQIAAESGATREQVAYAIEQVRSGFERQAAERLSRFGDPQAIHEFAQKHHAAELKDVMRQHATTRSPAVWDSIGTQFIAALDTTPEGRSEILNGNLGGWVAHESNGQIIVKHPTKTKGNEITWRAAVQGGLMKPTMGGGK
jgi:hypothetical protein